MESPPAASPLVTSTPVTNLAELLTGWALSRPDEEAVLQPVPERRSLTWARLEARVDAVASGLAALGLVGGHRVALVGPNSLDLVVGYLAVLRAGFVAVPLDPHLAPADREALLLDSGARVLLGGTPPSVPVVHFTLDEAGLDALAGRAAGPVSSPRDAEALAALLYTAGTSGPPRAAMLSHRALLAHLRHVDRLDVVRAGETVVALLPLFHVFGLNAVLGGWLVAGARLVVVNGVTDDLYAVLAAEPVAHLPLSPAFLHQLLADERDAALSGVQVVSGAAALPAALRTEFETRTGAVVQEGYGLTEAAPGVSATLGGVRHGHGHVGRLLPGVEVRIGDGGDPGEPGGIAVRGDNLFSGYWPDGRGGPDADGWFGTGDIGYLDADGELHLVDRAVEVVGVSGFSVYPAEVEEVIASLPGVEAVAVVGRSDAGGEQVVAFVVGEVSADEVLAHCRDRLAVFKRPRRVELLTELPRGATGKVRKGVLRDSLSAAALPPAPGEGG